jgi:hypothetical protein
VTYGKVLGRPTYGLGKIINYQTTHFNCQDLKPKDNKVTLSDGRKVTFLLWILRQLYTLYSMMKR